MIDNKTTRLQLPLPNPANDLQDDVLRLIDSFEILDEKVATLDSAGKVPLDQLPDVATLDSEGKVPLDQLPPVATLDADGKVPLVQLPPVATLDSNGKIPIDQLQGVATLDVDGKVPLSQLPPVAASDDYIKVKDAISQFVGALDPAASWDDVPSHSNQDFGAPLNAQSAALAARTKKLKADAEDFTSRLASQSGASLVGGVARPAASTEFSGGMSPSNADNKAAAASAFQSGQDVRIESGEYLVSGPIISSGASKVSVRGVPGDTTIKMNGSGTLLSIKDAGSSVVQDLILDMSQPSTSATKHGIALVNQSNLVLSGLSVKGLDGIGSGILLYSADGSPVKNALLKDIDVEGDRANSTNTNGFVLVDTIFSHVTNAKVSGVAAFALELKNNSEHNIISNSSAENSDAGLYYGSDVVGKNPRYNVAVGIIAKDCLTGYTPGGGTDNVLSGMLFDMRGILPNSSTSAVRIGSASSSIYGAHAVGAGNIIRYDAEARDNFTQVSVHPTSSSFTYVAFEAGSERNVTEITHPGAGNNTIRPKISRPAGMPVSGPQANPAYCHASGEYLGTLGTGWLWQHADVTTPRAAYHKWRFEGAGDSYVSLASDGLGSAGYTVSTPSGDRGFTWLESGQYWQLSGNNYNVRFYGSTIRPGADKSMDFGTATFRGRTAFFETGTINTSDAREKTEPVIISELSAQFGLDKDAILDAWGDVQIIAFQWLGAIQDKGDDIARWHFGVIAQQVRDAFLGRGLDGTRFGLLCYDEWGDEYEKVQTNAGETVTKSRTVERPVMFTSSREVTIDRKLEDGTLIKVRKQEEYQEYKRVQVYLFNEDCSPCLNEDGTRAFVFEIETETVTEDYLEDAEPEYSDVLVCEAGNRWGIRPDQCLFLEAEYQRRERKRDRDEFEDFKKNLEDRLKAAGL